MKIEWSAIALADLNRFAAFLQDHHPGLARIVADAILAKAAILETNPELGRPVAAGSAYRQIVLRVLRGRYVLRYRVAGDRIVMLRVLHGRESGK